MSKFHKNLSSLIAYEWRMSCLRRDNSYDPAETAYYQGCMDTCNEILAILGCPRFDSTDELMTSQARKISSDVRLISDGKWRKVPDVI